MSSDEAGAGVDWTSIADTFGAPAPVRSVINPDELRHIGPVADVRTLLRARRPHTRPPTE